MPMTSKCSTTSTKSERPNNDVKQKQPRGLSFSMLLWDLLVGSWESGKQQPTLSFLGQEFPWRSSALITSMLFSLCQLLRSQLPWGETRGMWAMVTLLYVWQSAGLGYLYCQFVNDGKIRSTGGIWIVSFDCFSRSAQAKHPKSNPCSGKLEQLCSGFWQFLWVLLRNGVKKTFIVTLRRWKKPADMAIEAGKPRNQRKGKGKSEESKEVPGKLWEPLGRDWERLLPGRLEPQKVLGFWLQSKSWSREEASCEDTGFVVGKWWSRRERISLYTHKKCFLTG